MFLNEFKKKTRHTRKSKLGVDHTYERERTYCSFRCDNCDREFVRERGKMDPKRISNNYFHVCENCDAKSFAQKMGITRKKIWDMPASSNLDISKL